MRPQYYGTVDTAAQACLDDAQPMPEGDMYDNCNDGVDNDCDGAADMDDGDCTMMEADVWLKKVIAHRRIQLKTDQSKRRRVFVQARGDTKEQEATVTLTADFDPEGVTVVISPEQITKTVGPAIPDDDYDLTRGARDETRPDRNEGDDSEPLDDDEDDDGEDRVALFKFWPTVTCNQEGSHTIHWTAIIDAPENRDETGDTLTARTTVHCRPGHNPNRPHREKADRKRSRR